MRCWGRGWFHTDRRSFGPGARTETHASRPGALATQPDGPARRLWRKSKSREATEKRHEAGGVSGSSRQKKCLRGLDSRTHRRQEYYTMGLFIYRQDRVQGAKRPKTLR